MTLPETADALIHKAMTVKLDAAGDPGRRRKLPPIEGMPTTRPTCAWCGMKMPFWTNAEHAKRPGGSSTSEVIRRMFYRWRGYPFSDEPIFHSLGCALKFATACYRGGYRRKK